jgi:hypothetical protein
MLLKNPSPRSSKVENAGFFLTPFFQSPGATSVAVGAAVVLAVREDVKQSGCFQTV